MLKRDSTEKDLKKHDLSFIDEEIKDVNKASRRFKNNWSYIKRYKKVILKSAFVNVALLFIVWIQVVGELVEQGTDLGSRTLLFIAIFSIILIVGLGMYLAIQGFLRQKLYSVLMYQFARRNKYEYIGEENLQEEKGSIFNYPFIVGKQAKDLVEGKFLNRLVRIFYYTMHLTRGGPVYHTVLSFSLSVKTHRMYLDAYGQRGKLINQKANKLDTEGLRKITLESNEFEDKFDLYATPGQHVPALQIFTPDFMAKLLDMHDRFDVELVEDELYIYEQGWVSTKRELDEMFEIAKEIVENIDRAVKTMKI